MATLSEDGDSWKASSLKRRDFRHTHDGPEVPKHGNKKKNTKKWCKGKVGKEHDMEIGVIARSYSSLSGAFVVDKCKGCGKEMNWRWNPAKPKPSWWKWQ
jgi:hypothetical protein